MTKASSPQRDALELEIDLDTIILQVITTRQQRLVASYYNRLDALAMLLKTQPSPPRIRPSLVLTIPGTSRVFTALTYSAYFGHLEMIMLIFALESVEAQALQAVLWEACDQGHSSIVTFLLDTASAALLDPHVLGKGFCLAAAHNHIEVLDVLLSYCVATTTRALLGQLAEIDHQDRATTGSQLSRHYRYGENALRLALDHRSFASVVKILAFPNLLTVHEKVRCFQWAMINRLDVAVPAVLTMLQADPQLFMPF